jgi:acyl-CoA thioester hydrolase
MLGIGRAYPQTHNHTFMTVETHVCYLREVLRGAHIVVELRVLGIDSKRAHVFSTVRNADAGYLAATAESLLLNIDLDTRRAAPWPEDIRQTLTRAKAAHEALAWPEQVGRRITLPGR